MGLVSSHGDAHTGEMVTNAKMALTIIVVYGVVTDNEEKKQVVEAG